jgi:thiol-disulfide isomerase/thioredoxin
VVVNEWASWCLPCRSEFPLLRAAAAKFGGRVAFIGLDVSDSAGDARAFLDAHPLGYLSYADPNGSVAASFGNAQALPTTIFFGPNGRSTYTHIGSYSAPEALDSDVRRYGLGE